MTTSKVQKTISQPVRAALGLREGDVIAGAIAADRVVSGRATPDNVIDDPFAAFFEWDSVANVEAYAGL